MNGKTGVFITTCWVMMALCCCDARGQDSSRVQGPNPQDANALDASVHANVEEGGKPQPRSAQPPDKRPTSYSKWGFASAKQTSATQFRPPPATTFHLPTPASAEDSSRLVGPSVQTGMRESAGWPGRTADSTNPRTTADAYSTRAEQSNLLGVSPTNNPRDRSTGRQRFGVQAQPLSVQPATSGASTPFGKPFDAIGTSSLPNPFPKSTYSSGQDSATAKQRKSRPQRPGEKVRVDNTTGTNRDQGTKIGSRPIAQSQTP